MDLVRKQDRDTQDGTTIYAKSSECSIKQGPALKDQVNH